MRSCRDAENYWRKIPRQYFPRPLNKGSHTIKKINVKVIPNAKKNSLVWLSENEIKVHLHAPAVDGKANAALIVYLAEELSLKKRQLTIVSGLLSRQKIVAISNSLLKT